MLCSARFFRPLPNFRPSIEMGMKAGVLGLLVAMAPGAPVHAQSGSEASATTQTAPQPTILLADSVIFDGLMLVARGSVEVLHGTRKMTATEIRYNQDSGALTVEGPIRIEDPANGTVFLASAAEIDSDLTNGLLTSARLVIEREMHLAAERLEVVDGRYTRLQNSVVSTCEVCKNRPVPLWEIRAQSVEHDQKTKQVYFKNAHLRVMDVPIFWVPYLRIPDPTLKRASGFLVPNLRYNTTLGTGIEIPYFFTLGDHRDLTATPYIGTKTRSLGLRYRQAFATGDIEINAAASRDDTRDSTRAYLFAQGDWQLGRDLDLAVDLRFVSDNAYLIDYDISDEDFLPSKVSLSRYSASQALNAELIYMRSLRDSDRDVRDRLPLILGEVSYEQLYTPASLPGRLSFGLTGSTSYRASTEGSAPAARSPACPVTSRMRLAKPSNLWLWNPVTAL